MNICGLPVNVIALSMLTCFTPLVEAQVMDEKIDKLIVQLSLAEKAALTSGASMWTTKAIDRLGIPSIMMTDGPHGVRKSIDGQFGDPEPATCYPPAVTLASTWNSELAYKVGSALGRESQAMGVQILLGPGTNIKRSPLGGRNFEYFSEDPILSGKFSSAYIQGVQSQGVGVSLKHFAVNDQEHERMTISAELSSRALHEIYLRPFEIAVREAQPTTLMSAYNKINGIYASNNEYLLDEVLRKQWGFRGMVITDWGAVDDRVQGIRARLNLQMPADGGINDQKIIEAVRSGELAESELDEVLRSTLRVILRLDEAKGRYDSFDREQHHQLAYKVASEGIVLLKNENEILPLGDNEKIAIIGNFAKIPRYQGSGSSLVLPTKIDNLIDNLNATFVPGYNLMGKTSSELIEEAKQAALAADKVVLVIGLTFLEESEGFDRANFGISPGHRQLLDAVVGINPNVIVVLQNGSPVAMPWIDRVDGVIEAYLGGQASGRALADVLTGKVNPSGKLAETFPVRIEDNPTYIAWGGEEGKSHYNEGVFVGYRYYDEIDIEPQFPFGYGLSYTTFEFSDISVDRTEFSENDTIKVSLSVKNTGKVAGQEVVQLYVKDLVSSVRRPEKELKHFSKIFLKPGEAKEVSFSLSYRDFAFYSALHQRWITESGGFSIMVGSSSRNLPLRQEIDLTVLSSPKRVFTKYSLIKDLQGHPIGEKIVAAMAKALGGVFPSGEALESLSEAEKVNVMKREILITNMMADFPIKNIVPFSKGEVSEADLDNILVELNR